MSAYGPSAGQYVQYGAMSNNGPPPGFSGSYEVPVPQKTSRSQSYAGSHWLTIAAAFFVPWLIFTLVFTVESTSIHYSSSSVVTLVVILMGLVVIAAAGLSVRAWLKRKEGHDPSWYIFLAVTGMLALVLGIYLGDWNYETNMVPYEDIQQLATYSGIDPSTYVGAQLMDSGTIKFVHWAHLDIDYSMGFQNVDTYCVAPVAANKTKLTTYDFWAVGLNCCSGHKPDFHCGEYSNAKARSGLRLMREELRSYFRLAVQQAEAAYNIHAGHPIFLEWMQDPDSEINAYQDAAYKYLLIGIFGYLGCQLVLVVLAVIAFSKAGVA